MSCTAADVTRVDMLHFLSSRHFVSDVCNAADILNAALDLLEPTFKT